MTSEKEGEEEERMSISNLKTSLASGGSRTSPFALLGKGDEEEEEKEKERRR